MIRYILSRLVSLGFVVIVVSMITFSLMHAVPGGPFDEGKRPASTGSQGQHFAQIWPGQAGVAAVSSTT